ncbi:MAG: hypothetical protein M3333_05180 [Actinomycetota bacterium]|nr:hypothetical protein [Actinomycetota bacterium]
MEERAFGSTAAGGRAQLDAQLDLFGGRVDIEQVQEQRALAVRLAGGV